MSDEKIELEEAKIILQKRKNNCIEELHKKEIQAIEIVLEALEKLQNKYDRVVSRNIEYDKTLEYLQKDSISKKKIEEYLTEETEKYKVYKKEVDKNENLRPQLWNHLGRKNMCEKILGIEKAVTLD